MSRRACIQIEQSMAGAGGKQLGVATTVVALVNGMIGGSILVLPLVALEAGWASSILIIFVTGLFSYYSCFISLAHLGDQGDLDGALLRHFNGSRCLKLFYDFCVWAGVTLLLNLYFDLIVIQWEGLAPPYRFTVLNPLLNALVLVGWCLCLRFFDFGAHVMGYGVVSILAYLLFLVWVVADSPSGEKRVPALGGGLAGFAAMMGNAFAVQGFFIPVMRSCRFEARYNLILLLAFLAGMLSYYYIAFMGAFGIVNGSNPEDRETIEGYFGEGQWEVRLLEAIYLVHLYSVFPEYLFVSKKRFFSMCGIREAGEGSTNRQELLYLLGLVLVCACISILQLNVDIIIELNGALLGFCFVYLLPAILHLKCLYFSRGKRKMNQRPHPEPHHDLNEEVDAEAVAPHPQAGPVQEVEMADIDREKESGKKMSSEGGLEREAEGEKELRTGESEEGGTGGQEGVDYSYFYCDVERPSRQREVFDLAMLGTMLLLGVFIMVTGLIQVGQLIGEE